MEVIHYQAKDGTDIFQEWLDGLRDIRAKTAIGRAAAYGLKDVADSAKLNAKTLYRPLSPAGNPELKSFLAILGALGLRLAVTPSGQPPRP